VRRLLDAAEGVAGIPDHQRGWSHFEHVLDRAGVRLSDATATALASLAEYHRTLNIWETVPSFVRPALARLRTHVQTLVVVSNANGTVRTAFDRLELSPFIDVIIDSSEEGVEKPDPRLFEIALERAGARAEATLHVGDYYHVDVVGARAAGLTPVLVDEADLRPDADCARIRSIEELPGLVAALQAGARRAGPE
jgi:HAD superfamily hydrolase (TIGR01509 family)